MARIRTIKPEFWTNERVMECGAVARLLFIGMWNFADDLGRLPLSAKTLKAQIFPSDDLNSENILGMIQELARNGLVMLYEVDGRKYIQITGWQHQRIDKPQPGKCPAPINGYSENILGMVGDGREGIVREKEKEGSLEDKNTPARQARVARETFNTDWPADAFEQFYSAYPRKADKHDAQKAFDKVRKRHPVAWPEFMAAVRRYAATADPQFTKYPATWLNKGGWTSQDARDFQSRTHTATRPRQNTQDALVAGMAAALRERPESRLSAGRQGGWGSGPPADSNDPAQPRLIEFSGQPGGDQGGGADGGAETNRHGHGSGESDGVAAVVPKPAA